MGFSFASFDEICQSAALTVCPLLGSPPGIQPTCYARNVEIGGAIVFQPAVLFIHVIALIMVAIMVLHVRAKYTAVGRKEIVLFFFLYAVVTVLSFLLDGGIIPSSSVAYPWFAAAETGIISATFWCLLVNGFVGFQFAEDGTPLSLWSLRISCSLVFGGVFFVAISTFKAMAGLSPTSPTVLWIIMYIFNGACVVLYIIFQLVLVFRTLDDRWPIGDILFGSAFFAVATVILYAFSTTICDAITHYVDGLFFSTLGYLLSVMMVYKYWDSITKEDLEFSVGSKQAVWEIPAKEAYFSKDDDYEYYTSQAPVLLTTTAPHQHQIPTPPPPQAFVQTPTPTPSPPPPPPPPPHIQQHMQQQGRGGQGDGGYPPLASGNKLGGHYAY